MPKKQPYQPRPCAPRPELVPYHSARCIALYPDGLRCVAPWQTAINVIVRWHPTKGHGKGSLPIVLCWHHERLYWRLMDRWKSGELKHTQGRMPLAFGAWLGAWAPHFYYTIPFSSPTSNRLASFWCAHIRPIGGNHPDINEAPR